ncbi:MAG TPA: SDR family oxidoreductase [Pseudonocardia sp.]|nr:SDR family oxidoreductase [Pseudonocardia sp.]
MTGSGQSLGRQYAEALAAEGAKVVIAEINNNAAIYDTLVMTPLEHLADDLLVDRAGRPAALVHYVASKGAVTAMTRSLAKELGAAGIRVTGVSPGMTFTEATKNLLPDPAMGEMFAEMQAIKEKMQPERVVPLVLFLCSPESDFIVGQNYVVDGGAVMP